MEFNHHRAWVFERWLGPHQLVPEQAHVTGSNLGRDDPSKVLNTSSQRKAGPVKRSRLGVGRRGCRIWDVGILLGPNSCGIQLPPGLSF